MLSALESADARRFPDGRHQKVFATKIKSGQNVTGAALIEAPLAKNTKSGMTEGNAALELLAAKTRSGTNPPVNVSATVPLTGTMTKVNV